MSNTQKQEVERKDATFEFGGRTYTVDADAIDNLELFEFIEEEKYLSAAKGFLGKEQWDAFKDDHRNEKGRVPMEPVEGFLEALMGAVGGNS